MEDNQMEQGKSCERCCGQSCGHGMCGSCGMHGCKHCLLYWLLGLLALVIAFCLGFKLGELKSYYQNGYLGGHMRYGNMMLPLDDSGQNRMFYINSINSGQAIPATTASQPATAATTQITPAKK